MSGEISENDIIKYNDAEIGKVIIDKPYPFGLIKIVDPDIKEFTGTELICGKSKVKIIKPENIETTSLGAAYLAGLSSGIITNTNDIKKFWKKNKETNPKIKKSIVQKKVATWKKTIKNLNESTEIQAHNYLNLTGLETAYLINFPPTLNAPVEIKKVTTKECFGD